MNKKLILASASPRRRELLVQAGFEFEIIPSTLEEKITETRPEEVVKRLSAQKAEDVFNKNKDQNDYIVIGADTVVAIDDKILGKPSNKEAAAAMLKCLQGRSHYVYTGVALYWEEDGKNFLENFSVCTTVTFYPMTEKEIANYVSTGEPLDKAGAYGIQEKGALFIKEIRGDYNNVVGLPIGELYQRLNTNFLNNF